MDWETPADAWYVWAAVTLISLAMAGIVLGLPTGPPPDADRASNAIEETSGSSYEAATTIEHDADRIRIDGKTIEMENEHGTDRSSINYGQVVVVNGNDRLENITRGVAFEEEFKDEVDDPSEDPAASFIRDAAVAHENNSDRWFNSSTEIAVRQIMVEPEEPIEIQTRVVDEYNNNFVSTDLSVTDTDWPERIQFQYQGDSDTTVDYTIEGDDSVSEQQYIRKSEIESEHEDNSWNLTTCNGDFVPESCVDEQYRSEYEPYVRFVTGHRLTNYVRESIEEEISVDYRNLPSVHDERLDNEPDWRSIRRSDSDDFLWTGSYPLTVTAEIDGETCEGTIYERSGFVSICDPGEASEDIVDEHNWVELHDETEEYHVTLVVV